MKPPVEARNRCTKAGGIHAEIPKGFGQLQPTPAHIGAGIPRTSMAASCRKEAPALSAFLVVHIHLAAHDKGLGLAPRLRQAPLYQQHVQPLLIFHGAQPPPPAGQWMRCPGSMHDTAPARSHGVQSGLQCSDRVNNGNPPLAQLSMISYPTLPTPSASTTRSRPCFAHRGGNGLHIQGLDGPQAQNLCLNPPLRQLLSRRDHG